MTGRNKSLVWPGPVLQFFFLLWIFQNNHKTKKSKKLKTTTRKKRKETGGAISIERILGAIDFNRSWRDFVFGRLVIKKKTIKKERKKKKKERVVDERGESFRKNNRGMIRKQYFSSVFIFLSWFSFVFFWSSSSSYFCSFFSKWRPWNAPGGRAAQSAPHWIKKKLGKEKLGSGRTRSQNSVKLGKSNDHVTVGVWNTPVPWRAPVGSDEAEMDENR